MTETLHVGVDFDRNGINDRIEFSIPGDRLEKEFSDYGLSSSGMQDMLNDNLCYLIGEQLHLDPNTIHVKDYTCWFDWVDKTC